MIRTKYVLSLVAAGLVFMGCQTAANTNTSINANANSSGNTVAINSNANSSTANTSGTANDPGDLNGTPTEVYKAAYTARKNCDIAGLKKVMAKELVDFIGKMGKDDKKSVDEEFKELCQRPQAPTEQVRNEKISGDTASIEYLDENNEWQPMTFIREDGVWKMSLAGPPSMDEPANPINDKDDNRS